MAATMPSAMGGVSRQLLSIGGRQLPATARIIEVGPRDGLQTAPAWLPTLQKVEMVRRLARCGVGLIDAAAFVNPKWNPLLRDGEEVIRELLVGEGSDALAAPVTALVPNVRGLERAIEAGIDDVSIWITGSESFSKANLNMDTDRHAELNREIGELAAAAGVRLRGYVSCAVHCPFEGAVDQQRVAQQAAELLAVGCYEVSLADTTGRGGLAEWQQLLDATLAVEGTAADQLCLHIHNTCGQANACILFAMAEYGINSIETAVAGLGGCPYSPGASGNAATEDVVYMLHSCGVQTGIDLPQLLDTSRWITGIFGDGSSDSALGRTFAA